MTSSRAQPFVPHSIGTRIGHARRLLGVFEGRDVLVPDLAKRVKVTAESVYNWESDDAVPSARNFAKLAAELGVSVAYLHYNAEEVRGTVPDAVAEAITAREDARLAATQAAGRPRAKRAKGQR